MRLTTVLAVAAAAVKLVPGDPTGRGGLRSGGKKDDERWYERDAR